jgi:uncharacterized UBP type Zn finger protein
LRGRLASAFCCKACNHEPRPPAYEPFTMLPLIVGDSDTSFGELMQSSVESSVPDDYTCEACKKRGLTITARGFAAFPRVLVLCLQRVRPESRVSFDVDAGVGVGGLHWRAAAVHVGSSADEGHYVCVARDSDGRWYVYDDDKPVRLLSAGEVSDAMARAYILFAG